MDEVWQTDKQWKITLDNENARHFNDKQSYQLCIWRTCLQLSLFRPNSNTHRKVQFIWNLFFFFFLPVIESRWERNSLYWLHVYSIHWRSVVKSGGKTQRLFLLLPLLPGKLYFCKRLKGNGKRTEKRTAVPGHHSLLAYFACSYFRFLATGISFSLRTGQQQTLRLPHLILTMTAKDVAEEQRKEESHH